MNNIYCPNHYWTIRNKSLNPTTGKQYFPGSGHRPGTAAEEAAGGRTRPAQEKKSGFWNGYVILHMHACVRDVCTLYFDTGY